jgi:tripartite-type tricarboxylate transporter receptor subunit TctC
VRKWIAASIGLALLACSTAQGQTVKGIYPDRPVRMIVPFAAGGPGDIFARLIGQKLSEQLGQQFIIENRPGAGGNIGAGAVARTPADGYTLLIGSSWVLVNASLYPQVPYDPVRDFEPIIIGSTSPQVLVVHPSVPAQTVQELVALAQPIAMGSSAALKRHNLRQCRIRCPRFFWRNCCANAIDASARAYSHRPGGEVPP